MLDLKNIKKDYMLAGKPFPALKGIDLNFKDNEFVSILGPSGCGKTTLLNLIGGLDRYTSGDLLIEGKSTKDFKDQDWDAYRNATIGFVFQTYNLISHLSVLDNVEMSLRLSVVERTKEIGIMRSLGARKKDISRIFNAETLLIGFTAGLFGISIAYLLIIPINIIVERFVDVENFASLLPTHALYLIVLSTLLTLIAGLFPSRIAAKRDPVVALRTE